MPRRPKLTGMVQGNPTHTRITELSARVDDHARLIAELFESVRDLNRDLGLLGDIVMRCRQREAAARFRRRRVRRTS